MEVIDILPDAAGGHECTATVHATSECVGRKAVTVPWLAGAGDAQSCR